ncbi:MAG: polysaccharide deacetylase family protein [Candidatus Eremiobacteraeota bacterium]|nr:polysaccharide deacetylase family protein [Candidatus Eremiobacteraeota bacterium]MCW5872883.1 polysaccharide deacetylase family protein [Candidatus Eremiobacteraeota bacterium]
MNDPLTGQLLKIRDWTYENYHWAYLAGTAVLCQSLFFPDPARTIYAWLGCALVGALLEPCVNPYRQVYGAALSRLPAGVALTFDDGPSEDTPALLDLLQEEGVKATFFVIGRQVEKYPEVVRRIVADGHQLGNHTYSHPNLMICTPGRTRRELERVQQQIQELTGQKPTFWRPPFGFRSPWTQSAADQLGLRAALWTVNPRDFQDPGVEVIVSRTLEAMDKGVIILLHDGLASRSQTIEATRQLIRRLKEKNYLFVRLDESNG